MQNPDIARLLDEVADLLEISEANPFKVRAYRNAARTVRDHPDPLAELVREGFDLTDLPGIGEGIADEIGALLAKGEMPQRRALMRKLPRGLLDLLRIPGLGPKRVKLLYDKLKVKSVADLATALARGKVEALRGFGPTMVEKIRAGTGQAARTERRLALHDADPYAHGLVEYLRGGGGGIGAIEVAGSFRRRRETIGDLDVLVTAAAPDEVMARFTQYPDVKRVVSQGPTRATVKLAGGLQVDLRAVEPEAYGSALLYFTGSKAHNVELRTIAQAKQLKLNEYGLYEGTHRIAGRTEEEVYAKLGLDWIPPELREARGEIELARTHRLPTLITLEDIRGDLQMHTEASDGKATIAAMAAAARALGYAYIAITDHSKRVSMSGLDAKALRAQWRAIDRLNAGSEARGPRVLKSVEMDILEDGRLDLPDDVLAEADYVTATIHYGLKQTERQITDRLLGAIANRWVDAIGHPTGRIVNSREAYRLDFDAVARAAAAAGCLLEINGSERMDLPDTLAAAAKKLGVRFVLSTDAHDERQLGNMRFAVSVARRAGLEAADVLNTRPLEEFVTGLRRARAR